MIEPDTRYRIEAISASHQRAHFDCGHPFLNEYLRQFARQNDTRSVARAYVLVPVDGNSVIGYYTLSASAIAFENLPHTIRRGLPKYPVPVVRIGELAVDHQFKGKGLGIALLLDALHRIVRISEDVAVLAVVVDPIDQQATTFYQHFGFETFMEGNTLCLTMTDVTAWLS